jgi:hypothetical protein
MGGDSAVEPKPDTRDNEGSPEKATMPLTDGQHDASGPSALPDNHIGSGSPPVVSDGYVGRGTPPAASTDRHIGTGTHDYPSEYVISGVPPAAEPPSFGRDTGGVPVPPDSYPSGSFRSGTPLRADDPATSSIPVTIYVEDGAGYATVERAVEGLLARISGHIEQLDPQ